MGSEAEKEERFSTPYALTALIFAISIAGLGSSYLLALFSLLLEARGYQEGDIGLSHSMQLGFLCVSAPLAATVLHRMPLFNLLSIALAMFVGCLALTAWLFTLSELPFIPFLLLRAGLGIGIGTAYLLCETWINSLARKEIRTRILAFYGACLATGMGIGPLLIPLIGLEGIRPFLPPLSVAIVGLVCLFPVRNTAPRLPFIPFQTLTRQFFLSPSALAACLCFGFSDACLLTLMPLYGLANGMSQAQAVALVTVGTAGAIVLQPPLGWLADHMDKHKVLIVFLLLAAICCALMYVAGGTNWLLVVVFLWGGTFSFLYTVSLSLLGEKCARSNIAVASMTVMIMYSAGALFGPYGAGLSMEYAGAQGMPLFLLIATLLALAIALFRWNIYRHQHHDSE